MSGLFVSYRRDDSQGYAGRLANDLSRRFGADRVFSDIEIPFGSDFGAVLHRAIAASDALLVVIGRHWADARGAGEPSRLFDPDDWVRTEVEAALAQGKVVVPVLVGGAPMPAAGALPASLRRLTRLQAASLGDRHWDADLDALAARLRELVPSLPDAADAQAPGAATASDPGATPAQALREIADRVLEEARSRPPATARAPPLRDTASARRSWAWMLLQPLLRLLRKLATVALVLALVYAGIRLFGDAGMLRQLDALEARLMIGWQRLLREVAAIAR